MHVTRLQIKDETPHSGMSFKIRSSRTKAGYVSQSLILVKSGVPIHPTANLVRRLIYFQLMSQIDSKFPVMGLKIH